MGITISSKNFSTDMGYGGFGRFRDKVATLSNLEFGRHYVKTEDAMFLQGSKRESFLKQYNRETDKLIERNIVTTEIANFCYQSDCEGEISQEQSKQIYDKIKDYDDDFCYGYSGRKDCAMFSDLKNIFKDCSENGDSIEWS